MYLDRIAYYQVCDDVKRGQLAYAANDARHHGCKAMQQAHGCLNFRAQALATPARNSMHMKDRKNERLRTGLSASDRN